MLSSDTGLALDERLRYVNLRDVGDSRRSRQYWPQLQLTWNPGEALALSNTAYYFDADRKWINSEVYAFNSVTGLIDRDRFFVFHGQELFGDQLTLTYRGPLFGRGNTFVAGIDYSNLDFTRSRGFPDGDSVNPFNPTPGVRRCRGTEEPDEWDSTAVFEDALEVTQAFKLVIGARFDRLDLDRKNFGPSGAFQPATSFTRTSMAATGGSAWSTK